LQIVVETYHGEKMDRLSPWATYVVQPPREEGVTFKQKVWNPSDHVSVSKVSIVYLNKFVCKIKTNLK